MTGVSLVSRVTGVTGVTGVSVVLSYMGKQPDSVAGRITGWLVISHSTSVDSCCTPSHSQSVGVLCSGSSSGSIKHCHPLPHSSLRVSGPSDSGSRSTSGDTGEGELRTGPIEVRVHSQYHTTRYCDVS